MAGDAGCNPASAGCGRGCASFESELLQSARIVGPVLAHLHPQVQVHTPTERRVQGQSRRPADTLQALALRADDDGFLAWTVNPYRSIDCELTVLFGQALDFDRDSVRHFLIELQCQFLANQLSDTKLEVAVR